MILTKFESLKKRFLTKTPKQKWLLLFNFTNSAWEFSGQRFLTDGKLYWRSYICCALAAFYFTLLPYSSAYHISQNNFGQSLFPICMLGIITSVSVAKAFENTVSF